ncbi:hypothetical protein NC651_024763 [Populus alba x Populus x berolinensis]|nr:hypothetical protein NC651_024763 [Populus alba x Populus x berolinensis]
MWYSPKAQFVVTEPELVKEILNNKDKFYPKGDGPGYFKLLLGNNGVTTSEDENGVEMTLQGGNNTKVERSKSTKNPGTAFGSSYLEEKNVLDMLMKLSLIIQRKIYKPGFPVNLPFSLRSKLWRTEDEIESEELVRGIRYSVKNRGANGFDDDFLAVLMNAFQDTDENKRISLEDLVDVCKTFYISTHQFLVCLDYPAFSNPSRLARRSQDIWPTKTKSRWHCKT